MRTCSSAIQNNSRTALATVGFLEAAYLKPLTEADYLCTLLERIYLSYLVSADALRF